VPKHPTAPPNVPPALPLERIRLRLVKLQQQSEALREAHEAVREGSEAVTFHSAVCGLASRRRVGPADTPKLTGCARKPQPWPSPSLVCGWKRTRRDPNVRPCGGISGAWPRSSALNTLIPASRQDVEKAGARRGGTPGRPALIKNKTGWLKTFSADSGTIEKNSGR
jgi:hypothetical protein